MMSTRRLGILLLGILVLVTVLVVANATAYSGSEGGYHVKLVVPQEHSNTSPDDGYNMTFIASTQTAGFLGTEGGYNLNLNLYTSGVGGAYNESGLRLYLVPEQAFISHWCDIPANDPICLWERLRGGAVVAPVFTLIGTIALIGILSVLLGITTRSKKRKK
ncbi:MAG TPA: hypothetical protein VMW67_05460 [Desulfobacteria bacterium]|nr:hypothetical protein [Desulfobacteria bacterium]